MNPKKTATLAAGLVTTKGAAAPAGRSNKTEDYYKPMTVKFTRARFEAIKRLGTEQNKSSQMILVEAFDAWLARADSTASA
jgi:hypothetical protein